MLDALVSARAERRSRGGDSLLRRRAAGCWSRLHPGAYRASVAGAVEEARRVRRGLRREVAVSSSYEVAAQIEAEARRRGYAVGAAEYSDVVVQRFAVAEEEIASARGARRRAERGWVGGLAGRGGLR